MALQTKTHQPYKYLAILDFESSCEDKEINPRFHPQEIIEVPILLLNTETFNIDHTFHSYVRPTYHRKLTKFCTKLTGINQQTVDKAKTFDVVYEEVVAFVNNITYRHQKWMKHPIHLFL